ncbi:tether containing UBX domain for GLUT4-like [Dendronephthya gigantea]|uniref:tether containing UBX domain for GLUT4-like n=1 Tax=Dendronephthya gigantea TaxID=151771 RepID=UPI00106A07FF|nr:tether containing UBX domain for GLUT4-like [Dendronephthya gigantea]
MFVNTSAVSKMASCSVVNIQCPNGRRQKVKLTAHMTLLQVIQEVCKKQDLDSNKYKLKHQRKTLDSSLTIRFANLPNNAHLELIESADGHQHTVKKCVVALQLENGERLVQEFNSDNTLFNILMHWKSQSKGLTFEDTLDGVVCIYANQQIRGLEKLRTTTLSMIGLNDGRGVIRVIQPNLSKPEEDKAVEEGAAETATATQETVMSETHGKQSSEDMEVASASTSDISMASQISEDDSMQCSEIRARDKAHQVGNLETESHKPKKIDRNIRDAMDIELCESKPKKVGQSEAGMDKLNQSDVGLVELSQSEARLVKLNQSEAEHSKPKGKSGKGKNAMDIEQSDAQAGEGSGEICSVVTEDSVQEANLHPPPLESVASTSDGRTANQVRAFSGVGRTLSDSGPDVKKARIQSPPSSNKVTNEPSIESDIPLPDREPLAFRMGENVPVSSDEISDDFFEVTVDDLRLMLKDLKNDRTVEKPLMTTKMREEQEKSKIHKYNKVAIRIHFPDRTVLQGFFSPQETVSDVISFVSENLHQRNTNFYLYTTPPKRILDKPNLTLFEAKLFPTAIVHFGSPQVQESYLHTHLLQKMADFTAANEKLGQRPLTSSSTMEVNTGTSSKSQSSVQSDQPKREDAALTIPVQESDESQENTRQNVKKSVPKWFKIGK